MITKITDFKDLRPNNLIQKVLICLSLISTVTGVVVGQTANQRKLELIFQGDINSFSNGFNHPFAASFDGRQMTTVWKNKIVLWDVKSSRVLRIFAGNQLESDIFTSVAISQNGKLLAGGFYDSKNISGRVKLWDLLTGKEIDTSKAELGF